MNLSVRRFFGVLGWAVVGVLLQSELTQAAFQVRLGCSKLGGGGLPSCAALGSQLVVGSASSPGVLRDLAVQVREYYGGKLHYESKHVSAAVPVCSLKRGAIQRELLRQLGGTSTAVTEDTQNLLGHACGDLHQFLVTDTPKGRKFDLQIATTNPVHQPGKGPYYGHWERSHLNSAYVLGLEEALLEVRGELQASSGYWAPKTLAAIKKFKQTERDRDRTQALRKVLYAEVDQRARAKAVKSGMMPVGPNTYHRVFDQAGAVCAATITKQVVAGQIKGAMAIQQAINRDCMPKAKAELYEYARKHFPKLFALK
jgi:hypothetical protein